MVLCKKRGIDAHGLTVSPAELPVPWQRLHISPKITPSLTPLPMYCASQGAKMCAGTLHSVKFTLLCREVSPVWHWLGRTVFGTIWQLTHFNRVAKCCTLVSESENDSQAVCNLFRQGWKVRSCSIDAQSFGNRGWYINLSLSSEGKLFGNHFFPFLLSTPRIVWWTFAWLLFPHSILHQ